MAGSSSPIPAGTSFAIALIASRRARGRTRRGRRERHTRGACLPPARTVVETRAPVFRPLDESRERLTRRRGRRQGALPRNDGGISEDRGLQLRSAFLVAYSWRSVSVCFCTPDRADARVPPRPGGLAQFVAR